MNFYFFFTSASFCVFWCHILGGQFGRSVCGFWCHILVYTLLALFSAGSKRSEKPTKMLRVSSKRYWDHEKHVLLEYTSYEKNHSGEILVKNSN